MPRLYDEGQPKRLAFFICIVILIVLVIVIGVAGYNQAAFFRFYQRAVMIMDALATFGIQHSPGVQYPSPCPQ